MKQIFRRISAIALLGAASLTHAVEPGASAPAFSLPGIANVPDDKAINLADYRGQVVYVDFWASWCGPCRRSFPKMQELREKFGEWGFEVIAINLDENERDAQQFLNSHPVDFPIAWDPKGDVALEYQLKGMPSAYIVDQQGQVRQVVVGFDDYRDATLIEDVVTQLIGL
ncbi:TlpA family protein disulfide reductase [Marinimicrobium alkaliphilum]|uniref:TlpA family protein disulfide reductase n=1 Tax=Marinimicrobium alkaliphilum TaxID=2202654 RepID=UPI000DBA4D59|nr:TlpA disulfide reductase family protein [Marinimicrobium alkaliphilum]